MLTESDREIAMRKAREKLGITGENPPYWSSSPKDRELRDQLRQWYFHYIREEQEKQDRIARTTQKLEDFT